MNSYLNHNLDIIFIITPNILLKHNNYLYQNIKTNNYFMEILIYDYKDPMNEIKNIFFTIKKILKISIMRKYTNIMILQSNIIFKQNWTDIINNLIEFESNISTGKYGMIWLGLNLFEKNIFFSSEKQYIRIDNITKLNHINSLTNHDDLFVNIVNKLEYNGLIMSKNIFYNLYKLINIALETNATIDELEKTLYDASKNLPSYVLCPSVLINMNELTPLYMKICKTNTSYDMLNMLNMLNISNISNKFTIMYKSFLSEKQNSNSVDSNVIITNSNVIITKEILETSIDQKLKYIYDNYWITFMKTSMNYNLNHFNIYPYMTKDLNQHFNWVFYKYFYDDLINNPLIISNDDAINHYITNGYKELRYICLAEYLYDKNDSELESLINSFDVNKYKEKNMQAIKEKNLLIMPVIFLIRYDYNVAHF